jgi:hypothetical protein
MILVDFFSDVVSSVDDAIVYVQRDNLRAALYLVLGNDPEEIATDYAAPSQLHKAIDLAIDAFSQRWDGKKCPTKTI